MKLVDPHQRSMTSLVFEGNHQEQTAAFIEYMASNGVIGFKNHKAVGGCRIMNLPGLEQMHYETLAELIEDFV